MNSRTNIVVPLIILGVLAVGVMGYVYFEKNSNNTEVTQNTNSMEQTQTVLIRLGEEVSVGSSVLTFERAEPSTVKPGPAEVFLEPQYVFTLRSGEDTFEFKLSTITPKRVVGAHSILLANTDEVMKKEKSGVPANEVSLILEKI